MKKIIAALLAVVMIMTVAFAFASCSSKKYTDKEVTIPVLTKTVKPLQMIRARL